MVQEPRANTRNPHLASITEYTPPGGEAASGTPSVAAGPPPPVTVTRHSDRPGWVRIGTNRRRTRFVWLSDDELYGLVAQLAGPIPVQGPIATAADRGRWAS